MIAEEDYFYHLLAEEAGEIAQMASKTARFGRHEVKPGQTFSNQERLFLELFDLIAVFEMMVEKQFLADLMGGTGEKIAKEQKKSKVKQYMELSRHLGRLEWQATGKEGESVKSKIDGDVGRTDID